MGGKNFRMTRGQIDIGQILPPRVIKDSQKGAKNALTTIFDWSVGEQYDCHTLLT